MIIASRPNGQHVPHAATSQLGYPSEWELIDPELALLYLEKNTRNRKMNHRTVMSYVRAMLRGEWKTNGDTIRFSSNDELLNGQHTLQAIIDSGIPQLCLVVRGLPPEVFKTIDKQHRRIDSQDLTMAGFAHAHELAACIRLLWSYEICRHPQSPPENRLTADQLIQIAKAIPQLAICAQEHSNKSSYRVLPGSIGCALWFATRGMIEKRNEYFEVLHGNRPATKRHPAYALRERFLAEKQTKRRTASQLSVALAFKAWNLCYEGREVGTLKMAEGEAFPVLRGYGDELTSTFPDWVPAKEEAVK